MKKKLLMIASTVSPRWGSEGGVGWNWLANVPQGWSTTLLTSPECAEEVRWGRKNGREARTLDSLCSPEKSWRAAPRNRLLARLNEWLKFRHNLRELQGEAERLAATEKFSVVHQTTIASWMCGMPSHALGIPSVWGPIGGGETFPWRYATETSATTWVFEGGRSCAAALARSNRMIRRAVREVDVIIATNRDTEQMLVRMGRKKPILRQPMVIGRERYEAIRAAVRPKGREKLRVMAGGSVEGRKGIALTIKALRQLAGVPFEFTVTGHGMELEKLRQLTRECGVSGDVRFETDLGPDAYIRKLAESHVFCFPSLRDNSPVTLVEAMAAGCIPVVLDNGGPAEAVAEGCGFRLPVENPSATIGRITATLQEIWAAPGDLAAMADKATQRVKENYLESGIGSVMAKAYDMALEISAEKRQPPDANG